MKGLAQILQGSIVGILFGLVIAPYSIPILLKISVALLFVGVWAALDYVRKQND